MPGFFDQVDREARILFGELLDVPPVRGRKYLGTTADDYVERAARRQRFEYVPTVCSRVVFDEIADDCEVGSKAARAVIRPAEVHGEPLRYR